MTSPNQRKLASQQQQRVNMNQQSQQASGKRKSPEVESSNSSFIFIVIIGFILLIAYTVWSSIQTYSNMMISDMEQSNSHLMLFISIYMIIDGLFVHLISDNFPFFIINHFIYVVYVVLFCSFFHFIFISIFKRTKKCA